MIVVDSNLLVAFAVRGPRSELADGVYQKDPVWCVPPLWRQEMRNALVQHCRAGRLAWPRATAILSDLERRLEQTELAVHSELVLVLAEHTRLSAYDAEFGVLAEVLDLPLLTWDGELIAALPHRAMTPETYLALA